MAHSAGSFASTVGRIKHDGQVWPNIGAIDNPYIPRQSMSRFWGNSLVHDPLMLEYLVKPTR